MRREDMNQIARDLMEVRAQIAQLEAEAETLTDWLKAEMTERGEEVLIGDGWKASWKNVTSSRLDSKALKAALPEIAERFTKTTVSTRFVLSV